jgi:hypothetical protein
MPQVKNRIIDLTAQIVSAHVAANAVALDQLPELIRSVHQTLITIGQAPIEPIKTEPAVAVKKFRLCRPHPLPRLRPTLQDAQAAYLDRSSNDTRRLSHQVGPAAVVRDGRR